VVRALDLQLTVMSSNQCNMAIFRFFKMVVSAILDFENLTFSTVGMVNSAELRHYAKFRRNRSNRGREMWVSILCLKMPNHAPFFGGGWGTFPPNDVTHRPNPKRTVIGLNHVIWAMNRNFYRGRHAVSLQTFTTRHSNRKWSIVMALSTTSTQYAPKITKFLKNHAK